MDKQKVNCGSCDMGFSSKLDWLEMKIPPLLQSKDKVVSVSSVSELEKAVDEVTPGTTIEIAEGVYQLRRPLVLQKDEIVLRGASQNRDKVVLLGDGFHGEGDGPDQVILVQYGQNITIADLTIEECSVQAISIQGWSDPIPHGIRIHNVAFINIGQRSIKVNFMHGRPHIQSGVIENCYVEQRKAIPVGRPDGFEGEYVAGIDAHNAKGWIIRDNVFLNIKGAAGGGRAAIFVWNNSVDTIIERNLIIGCDRGIAIGNPYVPENVEEYWWHTGGIVRNNFIYAPKDKMGIEIVKVRAMKFANNTIFSEDPTFSLSISYAHPTTSIVVENNLVHGQITGAQGAKAELCNNLINVPTEWFVNPEVGDLRLTNEAKEAIAAGKTLAEVEDDFFGKPRTAKYDIGAHQVTVAD